MIAFSQPVGCRIVEAGEAAYRFFRVSGAFETHRVDTNRFQAFSG